MLQRDRRLLSKMKTMVCRRDLPRAALQRFSVIPLWGVVRKQFSLRHDIANIYDVLSLSYGLK